MMKESERRRNRGGKGSYLYSRDLYGIFQRWDSPPMNCSKGDGGRIRAGRKEKAVLEGARTLRDPVRW